MNSVTNLPQLGFLSSSEYNYYPKNSLFPGFQSADTGIHSIPTADAHYSRPDHQCHNQCVHVYTPSLSASYPNTHTQTHTKTHTNTHTYIHALTNSDTNTHSQVNPASGSMLTLTAPSVDMLSEKRPEDAMLQLLRRMISCSYSSRSKD